MQVAHLPHNFGGAGNCAYFCQSIRMMRQQLKRRIIGFIDFFYPPFSRVMPLQTFRYAACGGSNTLLDIFMYWFSFHFILREQIVHLGFISISPYIASFILSFCVSFPTGFLLMRNVVFTESTLH